MVWENWLYWPGKEMDRMLREMSDAFGGFNPSQPRRKSGGDFPLVNMWSNEEAVILMAELPGVSIDKLNIHTVDNVVTIEGIRGISEECKEGSEECKEGEVTYHRRERACGEFKRMFRLPYKINPDAVEARYEKGILRLSLPRAEEDKPRKIKVAVAE